jgi:hypothetical protein
VLFRNPKLVHSISIHLIRVICGGSIRDEKQHIPADFSILPVNGYHILNAAMAGNLSQITDTLWVTKSTLLHYNGLYYPQLKVTCLKSEIVSGAVTWPAAGIRHLYGIVSSPIPKR